MTRQESERLLREKEQIEIQMIELLKEERESLAELGQEYYNVVKDQSESLPEVLKFYFEKIDQFEEKIDSMKHMIADIDVALQEPVVQVCPNCGKEMDNEARFCSACGTKLIVEEQTVETIEKPMISVCKNCGNQLKPGAHFCGKCGTAVSEAF